MLVDEFADVQEKRVDAVVAMKLHAAEMPGVQVQRLHGSQPSQDIVNTGARAFVERGIVAQALERGFEDAIRQRVVFEFIPRADRPGVAQQIAAERGRGEKFAANACNFPFTGGSRDRVRAGAGGACRL